SGRRSAVLYFLSFVCLINFLCFPLEWCVTGARREWAPAARGLLLAANGSADEILDGVSCGVIPLLCERAAARPSSQRGRRISDGLLRIADQNWRSRVGEIGMRLDVAQADLRVLCGAEEIESVGAPFPNAQRHVLRARRQAAVAREVYHFQKIVGRAVGALPDFQWHEKIRRQLIGRRGGVSDGGLQRRFRLRDRGHHEEHVILNEPATAGLAE